MSKLETSQDTLGRFAHALGADTPSVLDTLRREDYVTDDDYLAAATKLALAQQSPEYRRVYRQLSDEFQQRREEEQKKAQTEQYATLRKSVTLDSVELGNIEQEARRLAQADLAAGKIFSHQLGATISQYAETITEREKDRKAARQQMNAIFRHSSR